MSPAPRRPTVPISVLPNDPHEQDTYSPETMLHAVNVVEVAMYKPGDPHSGPATGPRVLVTGRRPVTGNGYRADFPHLHGWTAARIRVITADDTPPLPCARPVINVAVRMALLQTPPELTDWVVRQIPPDGWPTMTPTRHAQITVWWRSVKGVPVRVEFPAVRITALTAPGGRPGDVYGTAMPWAEGDGRARFYRMKGLHVADAIPEGV